jgi:hypothetical protein
VNLSDTTKIWIAFSVVFVIVISILVYLALLIGELYGGI